MVTSNYVTYNMIISLNWAIKMTKKEKSEKHEYNQTCRKVREKCYWISISESSSLHKVFYQNLESVKSLSVTVTNNYIYL